MFPQVKLALCVRIDNGVGGADTFNYQRVIFFHFYGSKDSLFKLN